MKLLQVFLVVCLAFLLLGAAVECREERGRGSGGRYGGRHYDPMMMRYRYGYYRYPYYRHGMWMWRYGYRRG